MNSGPTLSIGSTGPDVRRLQVILVMIKSLDVSAIDGVFGSKTQDAVKSFQQGNNLTADGIVGPLTWQRFRRTLKRRLLHAAQTALPSPHCKRDCWRSAVPIQQLILGQSMGTLARGLKQPCAPIKPSKI